MYKPEVTFGAKRLFDIYTQNVNKSKPISVAFTLIR
jgi:hypothetical protein